MQALSGASCLQHRAARVVRREALAVVRLRGGRVLLIRVGEDYLFVAVISQGALAR